MSDDNRIARAAALPARMPRVPATVVERMQAHLLQRELPARGLAATLQDFYARLDAAGLPAAAVTTEIFAAVGTSRTRLRALIKGLRVFAPDVPLAPAAPVTQKWDAWLNARYNEKPKVSRDGNRIAALPADWPKIWQAAIPALSHTVRPYGYPLRPLALKTRTAVIDAVGMLQTCRRWAQERGVLCGEIPTPELYEAYQRYLLHERKISFGSAADYIERTRMFFMRAGLFDEETVATVDELVGALQDLAADQEPKKRQTLRKFRRKFQLSDVLHLARDAAAEAGRLPGHSTAALRWRQKSVAYALLVNAGDRQGDLREFRIGIDVSRDTDGCWYHGMRQSKTKRRKDMDALWPGTCALLDAHVLADRPAWMIDARVAELHGANLLTLSSNVLNAGFINRRMQEDFEVHGHLLRSLITDAIRRNRPDAAWAAQHMLGHATRTMHEGYRTDFDESAAVKAMGQVLSA
ncbi:MAG: hypothetical protein ACU0B7_00920 [Paracoccaceae bacterium]